MHVGPRVPARPDAQQQRVSPRVQEPGAEPLRDMEVNIVRLWLDFYLEEGTDVNCDDVRTEGEEGKRSGKDYHRSLNIIDLFLGISDLDIIVSPYPICLFDTSKHVLVAFCLRCVSVILNSPKWQGQVSP